MYYIPPNQLSIYSNPIRCIRNSSTQVTINVKNEDCYLFSNSRTMRILEYCSLLVNPLYFFDIEKV